MKKYITEFLGTFILVFCGTAAIVINQQFGTISHVGVSMTFGLVVMTLIYAFGSVSGAHFNPAVSFAFTLACKFEKRKLLQYVIAQLFGALAASVLVRFLFPMDTTLGATIPSGSDWQSFILEGFLTFFLMLVILNVSQGSREQGIFAGMAIGATVMHEAMFAGPVSGASMNPARSLGPALISLHTEHLWGYLTAPMVGSAAAVPVWKFLLSNGKG